MRLTVTKVDVELLAGLCGIRILARHLHCIEVICVESPDLTETRSALSHIKHKLAVLAVMPNQHHHKRRKLLVHKVHQQGDEKVKRIKRVRVN